MQVDVPAKFSPSKKRRRGRVASKPHHLLASWLRSPRSVGAVVPSSRALARAMAAQVDVHAPGVVVELGPGTGVVTQALLDAGIETHKLLVIERDRRMYGFMASHFPGLRLLCADAMKLGEVLAEQKVSGVNAIVSSLPLLSMPKQVRGAIENQMAEAIGAGGVIVQFTYGPKSPISPDELARYRLWGRRVKLVVANIPPAHVWVYKRERRKAKR